MTERPTPRRRRLGDRLRMLRRSRFRSAEALARALGHRDDGGSWWQTRVSKMEVGRQLPSSDELVAWVAACGGSDDELADLQALLVATRVEYRPWDDVWRSPHGVADTQEEIISADLSARRIVEYQPSLVPGLAQTPAYTQELLSAPGGPALLGVDPKQIDEKVAGQVRRQQVLYTPERQVEIVMGEAALHVRFGSATTLVGQLDRLLTLADLPNVVIGILPYDRPSPVLPLTGFAMNDADVVWVETLTGEQRLDDPSEVAAYRAAFDAAMTGALIGAEAAERIKRVSLDLV